MSKTVFWLDLLIPPEKVKRLCSPKQLANLASKRHPPFNGEGRKLPGDTNGVNRKQRNKIIAQAKAEAKQMVKHMEETGQVVFKDPNAREAMEFAVETIRRTDVSIKDKLATARMILDFTQAKPATESNVNLKRAEDFLNDLAEEIKNE